MHTDDPLENRTRRAGESARERISGESSGRGLSGKTSVVLGAEVTPTWVEVVRVGVAGAPETENARVRPRGFEVGFVGLRLLPMRSRRAPSLENIVDRQVLVLGIAGSK